MKLNQRLGGRKPEPSAVVLAADLTINLHERYQDARQVCRSDADPGVGDGDADSALRVKSICPPGWVNLTALPIKLNKICRVLRSSARSSGRLLVEKT